MTRWITYEEAVSILPRDSHNLPSRTLRGWERRGALRVRHVRAHHKQIKGYAKLFALEDVQRMRDKLARQKVVRDAWRAAKARRQALEARRNALWQSYSDLAEFLGVKRGWLDRRVMDKTVRVLLDRGEEYRLEDVRKALAKDPQQVR